MTALLGLHTRLATARLLLVTDSRKGADLGAFAADVFAGGVGIVQLAEPQLSERDALAALTVLRQASRPSQAIVAVTADAEVAAEFGADMLVLLDDASVAAEARRRLHPWALLGRSCRSTAAIDRALADPDVDFLLVAADADTVRHAAQRAPQGDPASKVWFAAGGIQPADVARLAELGCRRVAVSRAITLASDPKGAAAAFRTALDAAWDADPAMEKVTMAAFKPRAGRGQAPVELPDAPDAGDGFGSLSNPWKNAGAPRPDGPRMPDTTL